MTRTYIIAEAGVNHNGSLEMALKLIDAAVEAGADAVKFQTFKADNIVSKEAPKADYQKKLTGIRESQYEMLKNLELDEGQHQVLVDYCSQRGIEFLSTPFDKESLQLLVDKFDLSYIKIPSGEITNAPFLLDIASTGKPVILSTGMSSLGEVEAALGILAYGYLNGESRPTFQECELAYASDQGQSILKQKVTLLHCTTEYPAPFGEINLRAMDTLRASFNLPVGFSDHTVGIAVPIAAAARGATVIEKHFTLDSALPGPDHEASLEPQELKAMVMSIRQVELALGHACKKAVPSELKNKKIARKSIVAAKDIITGELFSENNLTCKRPGDGISPLYYWDWLGKTANKDYKKDERVGI